MSTNLPRDVIKEARSLKSRAMNARDRGDFARAETWITEAETMLATALASLRATRASLTIPGHDPQPGKHEIDVAEQLGHILGSKGGIYRRWKKYDDSVDAYDAGNLHENWVLSHERENSYCLVQRLVARVFISPGAVDGDDLVKGLPLRTKLIEAGLEVARQRGSEGHRAQDEYAAADAALVGLLLGDTAWREMLDGFVRSSPPPTAFAVAATLDVVTELCDALTNATGSAVALGERLGRGADVLANSLRELSRANG